jgi:hypothetical protein
MRAGRWGWGCGWGFIAIVLASCLAGPASALAGDANSVPPKVKLSPGGQPEGEFGPKGSEFVEYYESLAFFETEEPAPGWAYTVGSTVSFSCLLDGQPVACIAEHEPCCRATRGVTFAKRRCLRRDAAARRRKPCRPIRIPHPGQTEGATPYDGPFRGRVPMPPVLAPGTHTLTVVASDEDGVDPAPPSIAVFFDATPPAAPDLLDVPAKVSRDGKPDFRFKSADDRAFPGEADHPGIFYQPFDASLRRVKPRGPTLHSSNPFGSYVSIWRQRCMTIYECSAFARPEYEAGNGSLGFGIPELLRPGLYEFGVQARDAVGNESPATRYRFRILPPKTR